jgi:hypothetical protein
MAVTAGVLWCNCENSQPRGIASVLCEAISCHANQDCFVANCAPRNDARPEWLSLRAFFGVIEKIVSRVAVRAFYAKQSLAMQNRIASSQTALLATTPENNKYIPKSHNLVFKKSNAFF